STATGSPVQDARVILGWYLKDKYAQQLDGLRNKLLQDRGLRQKVDRRETLTGPDGSFRFEGLWAMDLYVRVTHPTFGRADAQTHTGIPLDLRMAISTTSGSVIGMVTDSNGQLVDIDGDLSLSPPYDPGNIPAKIYGFLEEGAIK